MFAFFSQTAGQSGTVRMTLAMTTQWLDARDNRDALVERSMFDAKGDALTRTVVCTGSRCGFCQRGHGPPYEKQRPHRLKKVPDTVSLSYFYYFCPIFHPEFLA